MATDATGTPTTGDSIPTYNTAVDAPSGDGFNAAMAVIQTALTARIPKTLVTTTGDIIYASSANTPARLAVGSAADVLTVAGGVPTWAAPASNATYATTPPGSPTDGDIWYCVDATTNSAYSWAFRYNSANTTYKWEFIGGPPLYNEVATMGTVASGSYVDPSTSTPTVTLPRAGYYVATFSVNTVATAGEEVSGALKLGSAATADTERAVALPTVAKQVMAKNMVRLAAASDVWKLQFKRANATTVTLTDGVLQVTPVRVS